MTTVYDYFFGDFLGAVWLASAVIFVFCLLLLVADWISNDKK